MIYTHKREASELQIFQVRNSTPSAGVRPSLCEDGRRRPRCWDSDQSERGLPRPQSISSLINKYLWSSAACPPLGRRHRALPFNW